MKLKWIFSLFLGLLCTFGYSASALLDTLVFTSIDDEDYVQLEHMIVSKRVDINTVFTKNRETPLHYAAYEGKTEAVEVLLKAGIAIDALTPQKYSALHLAAQEGFTDIVKLLLQYKANQNIQNEDGFLPVHLAASFGRLDIVRILTKASGIVDMHGTHNVTPLQLAGQNGHSSILLYLLSQGADPNALAQGSHGTSLHFAVHGDQPECVKILLEHGAQVNKTNDTGDTPFVWNGYIGNIETSNILLAAGADKKILTLRYKYNALHTAAIRGKSDLIQYFLDKRIFTGSEKSGSGSYALHYAALYGHTKAIQVLVPYTPSIDVQDIYGQTPLHYAVYNDKIEAVKTLLTLGASKIIKNKDGETAINLAKRLGKNSTIEALI